MLQAYFKNLYQRTMAEAYGLAFREIVDCLKHGGYYLAAEPEPESIVRKSERLSLSTLHGTWASSGMRPAWTKAETQVQGYGFGLYPFPGFMHPMLERIDSYHCHQMVFIARK